uniref:SLED domain-containing protein n=1 Tax=Syphacia muris TaxID=451379 RepID=A0A0N5AZG6_9BILA
MNETSLSISTMDAMESGEVEFSWKTYMEQDGSIATYDQSLFPQLRCSERRLSELILRPGRKVIVRRGDRLEHAKIEIAFETKLYVTFNSGFECIDLDDVMPDNIIRINGNRRNIENEDLGLLSDNNPTEELTAIDLELAHLTMAEAVKVGQYFELQDRINPCKVFIAQVFENRGGLLLIGRNGAKPDSDRPIRVFVTDERCHALGWLESGAQTKLFFADGAESVIEVAKTNPVTRWVFEHFRVKEHKFQENMSLEVLQASNGGAFFAGHVTEIINSHYFTVRIAESLSGMEKTITCSKSHPQIFPSGWCQRHGLRLTPPSDYNGEEEFSMLVYEAKLGLRGKAPESLFDPPKTLYKPERLRNIEVLDIRTKNEMYPAKILRWMKHIVWVSYCHYTNATPPDVLSTRCGLIFPCGFAQQHGIRLCRPCPYERLCSLPPTVDRFGLRRTCTSQRTSIFIKRDKRFMPAIYLDNDLMLPTVYLRKSCFCGPFLDPAKVKVLSGKYPPGPLPGIIRSILTDIITCAYRPEDLSKLLSCSKDTSAPIIFAKARVHGKPYRFRVECCEKVSEFCGWLRNICILLDACPELFNISPEPCRSSCCYLRENVFMGSDRHAWTANYQNISTPPRKPTRVETCNTVSRNNIPCKRKKKNDKPQLLLLLL